MNRLGGKLHVVGLAIRLISPKFTQNTSRI